MGRRSKKRSLGMESDFSDASSDYSDASSSYSDASSDASSAYSDTSTTSSSRSSRRSKRKRGKATPILNVNTFFFLFLGSMVIIGTAGGVAISSLAASVDEGPFVVGSIYQSIDSTNPGVLFGGSWTPMAGGRVLVGVGAGYVVGATGGSEDAVLVSHTHTVSDPGHFHNTREGTTASGDGNAIDSGASAGTGNGAPTFSSGTGISLVAAGVSAAGRNMQPYTVVYMWVKTAMA